MNTTEEIRTQPKEHCIACGSTGNILYTDLEDRLFGAPGRWTMMRCDNDECGMLWLDPSPIDADLHKLYRSYYTHESERRTKGRIKKLYEELTQAYINKKYGYLGVTSTLGRLLSPLLLLHPGRRADADAKVFHLQHKPGGKLLEIGCGDGTTLKYLSQQGWDCTGIDFDPQAVATARKKGLRVLSGDLEKQGFDEEQFDAIVMSHVIEHVPRPQTLLSECNRIIKPGGKLICYTPNADSIGHKLFTRSWRGLEPPRHQNIFTHSSLTTIAKLAGMNSIECKTQSRARRIFITSRKLKKRENEFNNITKYELMYGELLEIAEGCLNLFHHNIAEELFMSCTKEVSCYK